MKKKKKLIVYTTQSKIHLVVPVYDFTNPQRHSRWTDVILPPLNYIFYIYINAKRKIVYIYM